MDDPDPLPSPSLSEFDESESGEREWDLLEWTMEGVGVEPRNFDASDDLGCEEGGAGRYYSPLANKYTREIIICVHFQVGEEVRETS